MNIFELPVHPDAEAFRMLPPDELQALADDIKEKGLNHPLVTTTITSYDESTGEKNETLVLVDGRNRREACKMAGVTPEVVDLNGRDVKGFITSENGRRRHDTKGMQAMSYAIMYPEKSQGKKVTSKESFEVSDQYINQARTVLEYCDADTVEAVKVGATTLPVAYEKAKEIRDGDSGPSDADRLAALYESDSDLADAVADSENPMDIVGAEAQARQRRIDEENNRRALAGSLDRLFTIPSYVSQPDGHAVMAELLIDNHDTFTEITGGKTAAEFMDALDVISKNASSFRKAMKEYSDAKNND